VLSGGQSGAV